MLQTSQKENIVVENVPDWVHYIFGSVLLVSSLAGIISNCLAILIFIRQKQLQRSSNILVMCLCLVDLTMASVGTPMVVVTSFAKRWIFRHEGCVYYAFIVTTLGIFHITILILVAIDRFIHIVKTTWKKYITKRFVYFVLIGSFVYSLVWAIFPLTGWNAYTPEGLGTACSITWQSNNVLYLSYSMTLFSMAFVIPVITIAACYLAILIKIRKKSNESVSLPTRRRIMTRKLESSLVVTSLLLIASFIFSWAPYAVFSLWSVIANPLSIDPQGAAIPAVIAKMSVFWNPVIYLYRNSKFRKAFFKEFPRFSELCCRQRISSTNEGSLAQTNRRELQVLHHLSPRAPTLNVNVIVPFTVSSSVPDIKHHETTV